MIEIQKLYSRLRCSYICRNLSIGNWPSFVPLGLKRLFQFQFQMKAILIFCRQSEIAAAAARHALLEARVVSIFCNSTICPLPVLFGARTLVQFLQFVIVALQLHNFSLFFTSSTSVFVAGWLAKVATVRVGVNATNLRNLTLSQRPIQWRQQSQLHTGKITTSDFELVISKFSSSSINKIGVSSVLVFHCAVCSAVCGWWLSCSLEDFQELQG